MGFYIRAYFPFLLWDCFSFWLILNNHLEGIKHAGVFLLLFMSFPAVGIQMKLEFFQRKFWTASRQVYFKLKFSLSLNHNSLLTVQMMIHIFFCHKQSYCKETMYLKCITAIFWFTFQLIITKKENPVVKPSCLIPYLWKPVERLLILGPYA